MVNNQVMCQLYLEKSFILRLIIQIQKIISANYYNYKKLIYSK